MTKTIFITGTSTGIGKATALHFANLGWNVVATMRNTDDADFGNHGNICVTAVDVTNDTSIQQGIQAAVVKFGGIDVLVNNAGYGLMGPLENLTMEQVRRQFDVNVIGLLATTKFALPELRKTQGTIVNISSIAGLITFPGATNYFGTKWAVEGISEGMVYELDQIGVSIKIIEPGAIKTDFAGRSLDMPSDLSPEYGKMMEGVNNMFAASLANAPGPEAVAQVIEQAVQDTSGQLRWTAGEDAAQWAAGRKSMSDTQWIEMMKEQTGI